MSTCCLSGVLASGTPKGREATIGGTQTYIAEPKDNSTARTVVFLVDIFGWKLPNVRLLADQYAAAGFYAYVPDVHEGDSVDESVLVAMEPRAGAPERGAVQKAADTAKVAASFGPWLLRHREAVARPRIEGFLREVRKIPGTQHVGAIGFCWGGRYALLAGGAPFTTPDRKGQGLDAVVSMHPSLLSVPDDLASLCVPTTLGFGSEDSLVPVDQVEALETTLQKKKENQEEEWAVIPEFEVELYENQVHGFALRGDWTNDDEKKAMDLAAQQGIKWFEKYLK